MRLTAFLLTACCISVSAGTLSQSNITYSGKDVKLETVFQAVKRQTGYLFFYDNALVAKAKLVTVDAKNLPLEEFMGLILQGQELTWLLENTTILIQKKKDEPKKKEPEQKKINPVKGTVRGPDGQPVANVNVVIKGSNKGTITNSDGTFSIDANPGDIIMFSSVGFGSKEIKVLNNEPIYLALEKNTSILDEVQIIAYGQTSKRFSTGNISTVKSEEIEKQPVSNPLLALQGRVPGLFITQTTGLPGSGVTVRIQGLNSIGRGNDPLYVIDGVPYTNQLLSNQHIFLGGSGGATTGSPFSFINPADIESIDVLKDADATAIYGSRAANGAILITTKKGKIGKPKVDINLKYGWGKVAKKMDLMNTREYIQMRKEAISNDGLSISSTDYDLNGWWDTTHYTDWQKELIGGIAKFTNISAGVSGGTAAAQYAISGTYYRQTNVFPGDFDDRKSSLHFNINNSSSGQRFTFQFSGNYLTGNNQLPTSDLTLPAMILAPDAPALYNSDGSLNWMPNATGNSTWKNPLAELLLRYKNSTYNLISNLNLSYQVIPGLEIKSSFGYTNLQVKETSVFPQTAAEPEDRKKTLRGALYGNSSIRSWIIEPQVSYHRSFANDELEILIGTSLQNNNSDGQSLTGIGYNSDLILEDIRSASDVNVESSLSATYKYNALFARLNYNREDKYILNLTGRRDGSSRFGSENLFQNFGSVGTAWIFSNEEFIQKLFPFLSFGKLRASYGTTGNDQIGDYQFMNLYSAPSGIGNAYQGASGLLPDRLPNAFLQWESTKKLQFGLNLGAIDNRILLEVNYFHNRSSNQILFYALPAITGFTGITRNFPATVQNTGWEFSLNGTLIKSREFTWKGNFNLTLPKNELIAFPNLATSNYAKTLVIGQPIGLLRVFDFIDVDPTTGINRFWDSEGDITTNPSSENDRLIFINTLPKYYGGFQNNFSYKGFELDIFFEYVKQVGQNYYLGHGYGSRFNINQPTSYFDRWQNKGDITPMQRYNSTFGLFQQRVAALSSNLAFGDASYLRLKNVSISWHMPEAWMKKAHLQSARLYMQGQNLLTITNYYGLDPETKTSTGLPPLRVITIGMQLII